MKPIDNFKTILFGLLILIAIVHLVYMIIQY